MTILDQIFAHKLAEVEARKREIPMERLLDHLSTAPPPRDFLSALAKETSWPALIAEVKCSSPSRGRLAANFNPLQLAQIYRENGASAISVLTDKRFFSGHLDHLRGIAGLSPRLPIMRKDFSLDPYQLYEARAAGADAVLLIVAALDQQQLSRLHTLALDLGMTPLVEVHSADELHRAQEVDPVLVGINNRDLRDFTVSLETTIRLRPLIPAGIHVVSESGIHTQQDIARLAAAGVDAVLIGEALVTAPDLPALLRALTTPAPPAG